MGKRVLILSAIEGHASLAKVVEEIAKENSLEIKTEIPFSIGFDHLYKPIYRYWPSLLGKPFKLSKNKIFYNLFNEYISKSKRGVIEQLIANNHPDLIVTVHFVYLPILEKLKNRFKFKWLNVVTDPVEIHPLLYSQSADINVGFGEEFVRRGLRWGVSKERLKMIGWLVGGEFYQPISSQMRKKVLRKWDFDEEKLTIVVCGGSEGTNAILKMLPELFDEQWASQIQIVIIAGTNKFLKKTIETVYEALRKTGKKLPKLKTLGFTKRMADILRVADLVIGKAGPNLLFESVAAKKPFVAITHIEGQETGNIQLIEELGLGWVAEKRSEFKQLFNQLMNDRNLIHKYDKTIAKVAKRNEIGLKKLEQLMRKLLDE